VGLAVRIRDVSCAASADFGGTIASSCATASFRQSVGPHVTGECRISGHEIVGEVDTVVNLDMKSADKGCVENRYAGAARRWSFGKGFGRAGGNRWTLHF
jgi:hypothetical protein